MNVLVLGASRNIGYYAALRLLKQGATVTYLLRKTSIFDDDKDVQPFVRSGHARLVAGDALNAEDVRRVWTSALEAGSGRVDFVLFSIGGVPSFSLTKGFVVTPPDLCTRSLLNLLRTLPAALRTPDAQPRFAVVTSMGLSKESHARLPLAVKPVYSFALQHPHEDKIGMERTLTHVSGTPWSASMGEPLPTILPAGWQRADGLPGAGELKHVVMIRPALLTDGACRADEVGKHAGKPYRVVVGDFNKDAYTVSRRDVGHFIANDLLARWSEWEGHAVTIAN